MSRKRPASLLSLIIFGIIAVVLFSLDIVGGSTRIGFLEALEALGLRDDFAAWGGGEGGGEAAGNAEKLRFILLHFRLPRAVSAAAAGAGLAISGLFMQTLFRNPLAGPSVLGITAGANLGAAVTVLILGGGAAAGLGSDLHFDGRMLLIVSSVLGSAAVLFVVTAVAGFVKSITVVLLLGIMFGYLANSIVSILLHFSAAEEVQSYIRWTFGSFDAALRSEAFILLSVVGTVYVLSLSLAKSLDTLLLGEEYAATMGVSVRRIRGFSIFLTALTAGAVHAFCGPVAFLGVAVPHMARGITGRSDHRTIIPMGGLIGASTALAADIVSHLPGGGTLLPLNAVTALIGAPVLVWVLLRSRSGRFPL